MELFIVMATFLSIFAFGLGLGLVVSFIVCANVLSKSLDILKEKICEDQDTGSYLIDFYEGALWMNKMITEKLFPKFKKNKEDKE